MRGAGARAGPVAVTVPVTTTAAARQAGLPARLFPGNRLSSRASGRGSRGGAVASGHGVTCRVRSRPRGSRGTRIRSTDFIPPGRCPHPCVPIPLPGAISPTAPGGSGARSLADGPVPSALIGAASRQSDAPPSAALKARAGAAGASAGRGGACGALRAARHGWRGAVLASRAVHALPGWVLLRRRTGAVAHHGAHLCAAATGGLPEPR